MLMTLISALHNLSRSVGCALLAAAGNKSLVLYFVGGEIPLLLVFKLARGDILFWQRIDGYVAIYLSIFERIIVKVIVDFTGCLHFRHPFELGKPGTRSSEREIAIALPLAGGGSLSGVGSPLREPTSRNRRPKGTAHADPRAAPPTTPPFCFFFFLAVLLTSSYLSSSHLHFTTGGMAFSTSMVWAQAFPFVALFILEEGDSTTTKSTITLFLIGSFVVWLILNIAFLYAIDVNYLKTFIGMLTGLKYSVELFETST